MLTQPIVIVRSLSDDALDLRKQFLTAFDDMGLPSDFDRAKAVFIKPNLTYPYYKKGVTTRKDYIDVLVDALRTINTTTKICIGEGEGGYNSFSMSDAMRVMGFYEITQRHPNVEIVNLSHMETRIVELKASEKPYPLRLPVIFFDEIDFSITCPLPKVHCMTGITLSFKNQWGCLPDTMRLKNHYVFNEIIGQICDILNFRYAFLDGKYGLNNNGPMSGDPIEVNWFVASNSLGAFDKIVSGMMGFDWRKIRHLTVADRYGLIPKKSDIKILGNPDVMKRKFKLKRSVWNYPALVVFRSKKLTHFFYFSAWAKFIHDVMYIFRKRPI